ncbi:hypothetical protein QTP88_018042 [Uroleucon formosanum]
MFSFYVFFVKYEFEFFTLYYLVSNISKVVYSKKNCMTFSCNYSKITFRGKQKHHIESLNCLLKMFSKLKELNFFIHGYLKSKHQPIHKNEKKINNKTAIYKPISAA